MKTRHLAAACLVAPLLGLGAAQASSGDKTAGQALAAVCIACHQADGSGMNMPGGQSWPRLAGLDEAYLFKQLQDMKSGARNSPVMLPFVSMLNDQQMRDVAAYYTSLPATVGKGSEAATPEQMARGEKLALRGDWDDYIVPCKSCHGPDNSGVGAVFPALAGQHAGYIADQLRAWQQGTRKNDPQELMKVIADRLDEQDIVAVAAWLSAQPAQADAAK